MKRFKYEFYNCVTQDKTIVLLPSITVEWWYGFTIKFGFLFWVAQLEYRKNGKL